MKNVLLVLSILFTTLAVHGRSTEIGNGGNAVVCPRGEVEHVVSYDLTESVLRYRLLPILPFPRPSACQQRRNGFEVCQSGKEVAEDILLRLKNVDLPLYKSLRQKVSTFWPEALLVLGELLPVNDTGLSFIHRGCSLEQLVIQHEPLFDEDSRYFISKRLWDLMDEHDRGIMILHEVLYSEALQSNRDLRSSEAVRYFNALLISNKISQLSKDKYQEIKNKVFKP